MICCVLCVVSGKTAYTDRHGAGEIAGREGPGVGEDQTGAGPHQGHTAGHQRQGQSHISALLVYLAIIYVAQLTVTKYAIYVAPHRRGVAASYLYISKLYLLLLTRETI